MVRVWYMDDEETDQRLEHQRDPPAFISVDDLFKRTGVEYFQVNISFWKLFLNSAEFDFVFSNRILQLNADTYSTDGKIDKIRKDRGYSYEDEVSSFAICEMIFCYQERKNSFR